MSIVDDFQDLDYSNPGGLPSAVKLTFVILLMIAIGAAGYFWQIQGQIELLEKKEAEELTKRGTYKIKQQRAAQLPAYKAQLEEMEVILNSMLRQLPSKNEMSDLIVDVSQTAVASGIDNQLFEPGAEMLKEFYAEKPIKLKMLGKFHNFGEFVSGVASLPRVVILTMHDISLKPVGDGKSGVLLLEGTAKTYRYLDEEEQAEMDEKASKEGGKK